MGFLRQGSVMVMGIVSTKTSALEDEDDLLRRVEEAAGCAGRNRAAGDQPSMGHVPSSG